MHSRLAPGVADSVEHLHGRTLEDLLAGRLEVSGREPTPVPGVTSIDHEIDADPPVRVRRYDPPPLDHPDASDRADTDRRVGIVWAHGGAWVAGGLDMPEADAVARRVSRSLGAVVLSVDYRLAPGAAHSEAVDDLVVAVEALAQDPTVDPDRLAVGGASAGGNLVAIAVRRLCDRGTVRPAATLLAYPATDPFGGPYPARRPSVCPELLWFDQAVTAGAFSISLAGAEPGPANVPAAGDLTGLPPTLVTTAEFDALADQAGRYADLLRAADVDVEHVEVGGVLHGYLDLVGTLSVADDALAAHIAWLAQLLTHSDEEDRR